MSVLPVILSYFAQSPETPHLAMLEQEQDTIQLAWESATDQPQNPVQVKYVARGRGLSKQDQIIQDIKNYGNRIVLFQFSGHAGPNVLQLGDGVGSSDGIASLLQAYAPNLKVVVLNGCSTYGQVDLLFEKGIRTVVATSAPVKDTYATQFAISFHQTLCAGKSIQEAYRDAILALRIKQLAPGYVREAVTTRSMLNTSGITNKSEPAWGLFTQDTETSSVSDPFWWALSSQPDARMPPAIFYETAQYQDLKRQQDEANNEYAEIEQELAQHPGSAYLNTRRYKVESTRNELQKKIKVLEEAVLRLAEEFTRFPLDTERLRQAKIHFDAGEYEKARAIFDAETELMKTELDALLAQQDKLAVQSAENQQNLLNKANEYLILARLTTTNFSLPDRFEQTKTYFTLSLQANRNHTNLFAFGKFLQEEKQFEEARPLYEEALPIRRNLAQTDPETYQFELAQVLNNLAALYATLGQSDNVLALFEEALQINRQLAEKNPRTYLPAVAMILNNLGFAASRRDDVAQAEAFYREALTLYQTIHEREHATNKAVLLNNLADFYNEQDIELTQARSLYEEALTIRRELALATPRHHLPAIAKTLNNLSILLGKLNLGDQIQAHYEEALTIYKQLATVDPATYQPKVALTQHNLADYLADQKKCDQAEALLTEALAIYQPLAKTKPNTYRPYLAQASASMSAVYRTCIPDKVRSLKYAEDALFYSLPFKTTRPAVVQDVLEIVQKWGRTRKRFFSKSFRKTSRSLNSCRVNDEGFFTAS
ncbi:tetratricopeptide repeat protein [Spirosoma sp. KNUC1025]|uniref:tetratricopeptide repeat protein n=1 Tax=Spirosoma sp. KNUC1025 TaxID=2894082 RepID=UPI00386D6482|nr:tetratricopeptide repeat protein [Spirosoma sp. KNUC1025]